MRIVKVKNYEQLSQMATDIIAGRIRQKQDLVLGLSAGSTPILTYQLLAQEHQQTGLDFSKTKTFNLDEYYGLSPTHSQSYRYFMEKHFFSKINLKKENIHFLNGLIKNPSKECQKYEQEIKKAGGVDLQILGIGHNGHIGFNEPGSSFNSKTRVVKLDRQTIITNSRNFKAAERIPQKALTIGIQTIMSAKEIILLAGKNKKRIISKVLKSKITSDIPATVLKKHPNCTIIVEMN